MFTVACFPVTEVGTLETSALEDGFRTDAATKIHTLDASVILFPDGFALRGDTIYGYGSRHWMDKDLGRTSRFITTDSIAAITYYEKNMPAGRFFGEFMYFLTAPGMTYLGVYCIMNPKACFGSCPTVYTYSDTGMTLEAELFSSSISKLMEADDLDVLGERPIEDGAFPLRITNEALETHYINQYQLIDIQHQPGIRVYPNPKNDFIAVREETSPLSVRSRMGEDVLEQIRTRDALQYRTGDNAFKELSATNEQDWIEVAFQVPESAESVRLVLRMRNSLLSTVLFYDLVLGSQGLKAIDWTRKMNEDAVYAGIFNEVYKAFSGIRIQTEHNGKWNDCGVIHDVGPINWKHIAVELPVRRSGAMHVRLEFFPDNILIDYIAVDTTASGGSQFHVRRLDPLTVINNEGEECSEILPLLQDVDEKRLVTNPGDSYRMFYDIPKSIYGARTLFIKSHGYYTEWVRGGWLVEDESGYRFNLFDVEGAVAQLRKRWIVGRENIESTFFNARIPVREEL